MRRILIVAATLALALPAAVALQSSARASQPMGPSYTVGSGETQQAFAAAVPAVASADSDAPAVYVDSAGSQVAASSVVVMPDHGCTPYSGRDNPHYSVGDISGHGWWKKGNCSNNTANVYNCLYEYYSDHTFRRKACSPKLTLKPYTGSGQRTVARRACDNGAVATWRNHVDVDVIGQNDTAEEPYNEANVSCQVTGPDQ